MPGGTADANRYRDHLRDWLGHGLSGCHFASALAARATAGRVAYWTLRGRLTVADVPALEAMSERSGRANRFFVSIFPHLREPAEIVHMLETLASCPRWSLSVVPWRNHPREKTTQFGLTWRTKRGALTSVMGFAPLGTMPVTRRAPYVAIAFWPRLHANPHRKDHRGEVVGFVDGAHGMGLKTYGNVWRTTKEKVGALLADPAEDRVQLRQVTFCLPADAKRRRTRGGL